MNPFIQLKKATPVFLVALVYFGLLPTTQAVIPAPDGGYPGGNTAEGQAALFSLTTGGYNTGVGFLSLRSNTTASLNTAIGAGTLIANTGDQNTAVGAGALLSNTTGAANTANGTFALFHNTIGNYNTANGQLALFNNNTGIQNTAIGVNTLTLNTAGNNNTATGVNALASNIDGIDNTADGVNALFNNASGDLNTAIGKEALFSNFGDGNTAMGAGALFRNTTGGGNTAIGLNALENNTTGGENIALGDGAGDGVTTAGGVISIGDNGANIDHSCFIGNIRGVTTGVNDAVPVLIDSNNQLGTTSSSRRYKTDIRPLDNASESILALKPVSFRYKVHKDSTPHFGLIAEEVAEVNRDLVIYDADGKPYTVRYDAVNAMLLNEFLKEHRKVEEMEKAMVVFSTQLKEQASQIQKVRAQLAAASPSDGRLEANKFATGRIRGGGPAPQMVNNP